MKEENKKIEAKSSKPEAKQQQQKAIYRRLRAALKTKLRG